MRNYLILALSLFLLSSCDYFSGKRVRGDGNVVAQSRSLDGFSGVDVSGAIEVVVRQDAAYSVKVETDNNLQEYVEIYSEGGILRIQNRNRFRLVPSRRVIVYVTGPDLTSFSASGACKIKSENKITASAPVDIDATGASRIQLDINAPSVDVRLTGASSASLKGETKELSIRSTGSSDVNAFELLSENTDVEVTGAGNAEVFASVKLEAEGTGASRIRYKGNASVSSNTSGASSVQKVN